MSEKGVLILQSTRYGVIVFLALLTLSACTTAADDERVPLVSDNAGDLTTVITSVSTTGETVGSTTTTTAPSTEVVSEPIPIAGPRVAVVSVTDGDTIRVIVDGVEEPLRLIGINTPEGGECLAAEASARLSELVAGQTVILQSDTSDRDQYDRLLRYVYAGDIFVNEVLVREGLAVARRYEPDTAMASALENAQAQAVADGVGMWASDACGPAASGDIRVGTIRYDADGDDSTNLNDEWVEIINSGASDVDLTGWGVKDESASHRYSFPDGFVLGSGETVRIYSGCGTDNDSTLYWCNVGSGIWNNSGDTVFVLDPSGNIVDSVGY